jgi:hypothetical protein
MQWLAGRLLGWLLELCANWSHLHSATVVVRAGKGKSDMAARMGGREIVFQNVSTKKG